MRALCAAAEAVGVPLWHTLFTPGAVAERLYNYRHSLEASTVVHGELLEVLHGRVDHRQQRDR